MQEFEVWAGGARFNEGAYPPHLLGIASGETFLDACKKLRDTNPLDADPYAFKEQRESARRDAALWDLERMTWWGCKLYESRKEAWHDYVDNYM